MSQNKVWKNYMSEEEVRHKIITEYNKGTEFQEIAESSGYHEKSVSRIIRNFNGKKSFKRKKGGGRPQILTSSNKIAISNCVRSKPWLGSDKIKQHLGLKASARTIRLFLNGLGYKYKFPRKKPLLT
jgi:Transposase and inactivated derivatives